MYKNDNKAKFFNGPFCQFLMISDLKIIIFRLLFMISVAYLELCQTSKMERFTKIFSGF